MRYRQFLEIDQVMVSIPGAVGMAELATMAANPPLDERLETRGSKHFGGTRCCQKVDQRGGRPWVRGIIDNYITA